MFHCLGSCRRLRTWLLQGILATIPSEAVMGDPQKAPDVERLSASVSLSDLDLRTPEGLRAAHERVRKEALRLCRKFSDSRRISDRETIADCMREATEAASGSLIARYPR
jgi:UrcA family protein